MMWLYDTEQHADRLDACVSRAMGWPEGGTTHWSDPRQIEQGDLAGMWYVAAPPTDVRGKVREQCLPDKVVEHSSDWHPDPDLA